MKTLFVTLVLLAACSVAVGQSMGSHSENPNTTVTTANHIASCGGSTTCWHQSVAGAGQLLDIYASGGAILGTDFNHYGYAYQDYPTNKWVQHPEWGFVYGLQTDFDNNVWVLYNNGNCPSGGGYSLGKWNGSSLTLESYCFVQFVVSQDSTNTVMSIDVNGTLWSNVAGSWQHVAVPSPFVAAFSVAIVDDTHYYITRTDGSIWYWNSSVWSQLPGTATTSGTTINIAADPAGDMYVIGGSYKNVYHWNGTSFDSLTLNGFNAIAVADNDMNVWGTGTMTDTNGTYNDVYRFAATTFRNTSTLQLTASCNGCKHSAYVAASWQGAATSDGGGQMNNFNPNGTFMISSQSDLYDPFTCYENDPSCRPRSDNRLACSVAGILLYETLTGQLPNNGYRTGSGYVTQTLRHSVMGTTSYCLADNCNPAGTMNMGGPYQACYQGNHVHAGGNVPDAAADSTNTDSSVRVRAFCIWGLGFITKCIVPGGTWSPWNIPTGLITDRNVPIPYAGCDQ